MQISVILAALASTAFAADIVYQCGTTNTLGKKYNNCSAADRQRCVAGCQPNCGFDYRIWDASFE